MKLWMLLAALTFGTTPALKAQNLVGNGDFNGPTIAPWVSNGWIQFPGRAQALVHAQFNPDPNAPWVADGARTLEQAIATTAGGMYRLSFDFSQIPYFFGVGGLTVSFGDGTWTTAGGTEVFFARTTSTSTTLSFSFELLGGCSGSTCDNWGSMGTLRNVSVSTVPEPGTYALVALPLLGLALVRRRRTTRLPQ